MKSRSKKQVRQSGKAKEGPLSDAMRNRVLTDVIRGLAHEIEVAHGIYLATSEVSRPGGRVCANILADRQVLSLQHLQAMLKRVLDRETVPAAPGYMGEDMKLIHP